MKSEVMLKPDVRALSTDGLAKCSEDENPAPIRSQTLQKQLITRTFVAGRAQSVGFTPRAINSFLSF